MEDTNYDLYEVAEEAAAELCILIDEKEEKKYRYDDRDNIYIFQNSTMFKRGVSKYLRRSQDIIRWSPSNVKRLSEAIGLVAEVVDDMNADFGKMVMSDCVYNFKEKEAYEFSPAFHFTDKVDYNYDGDLESPIFDMYMESVCCSQEQKLDLLAIMGAAISGDNNIHKIVLLTSGGGNGKSVFLNLLRSMLPPSNVTSLNSTELNADRNFPRIELINSKLNLMDELSETLRMEDLMGENIKTIVTSEPDVTTISAEIKGGDHLQINPRCLIVGACNVLPKLADFPSEAYKRRLFLVPFTKAVPNNKKDIRLLDKLKKERTAIFHKALKALEILRDNDYRLLTQNMSDEILMGELKKTNNYAYFVGKYIEEDSNGEIMYKTITSRYLKWTEQQDIEVHDGEKVIPRKLAEAIKSKFPSCETKRCHEGRRCMVGVRFKKAERSRKSA